MPFSQDVRDGLNAYVEKHYESLSAFCKAYKVAQGKLWKFLNGYREEGATIPCGMNSNALGELLDKIGARIVFPDEAKDRTRDVVFINAKKSIAIEGLPEPEAQDYKAVPLMDMAVAAGPGLLTSDAVRSWAMVYNQHSSVRMRSNLIAVEIARGQRSMIPTLHPLDMVLVDLDSKDPGNGKGMFLVKEPDGSTMVKRVSMETRNGKTHLLFYSDNSQEYPPSMYILEDDYRGDIDNAIVGKIIWAWSDMTQK